MTTPPKTAALFKDMDPSFDPSIDWLDGGVPTYPFFDQSQKMQSISSRIKNKLLTYGLQGVQSLIHQSNDPIDSHLINSLREQPEVWKAVLATQRYGGIYFFSRSDSREWEEKWSESPETISLIQQIDELLHYNDNGIKAINYAVHAFAHDKDVKLERETKVIPNRALSCRAENHIAVHMESFRDTAEDNLNDSTPRYDLHDFAHLTAATLCSELYGNQYHPKLINLPTNFTALIRSRNRDLRELGREQITLASDGIVFSEFLTKLFTDEIKSNYQSGGGFPTELIADEIESHDPARKIKYAMTYTELTDSLGSKVAEYLLGREILVHTNGESIKLPAPITPTQLAVLAQNKAYELIASEIEQRLFFRGRVKDNGEHRDELEDLNAWNRIKKLAASRKWTYFEVRNTIKHRAHTAAYLLVAEELRRGEDAALCQAVMDNITYKDWERGERVNLWDLIASSEGLL